MGLSVACDCHRIGTGIPYSSRIWAADANGSAGSVSRDAGYRR